MSPANNHSVPPSCEAAALPSQGQSLQRRGRLPHYEIEQERLRAICTAYERLTRRPEDPASLLHSTDIRSLLFPSGVSATSTTKTTMTTTNTTTTAPLTATITPASGVSAVADIAIDDTEMEEDGTAAKTVSTAVTDDTSLPTPSSSSPPLGSGMPVEWDEAARVESIRLARSLASMVHPLSAIIEQLEGADEADFKMKTPATMGSARSGTAAAEMVVPDEEEEGLFSRWSAASPAVSRFFAALLEGLQPFQELDDSGKNDDDLDDRRPAVKSERQPPSWHSLAKVAAGEVVLPAALLAESAYVLTHRTVRLRVERAHALLRQTLTTALSEAKEEAEETAHWISETEPQHPEPNRSSMVCQQDGEAAETAALDSSEEESGVVDYHRTRVGMLMAQQWLVEECMGLYQSLVTACARLQRSQRVVIEGSGSGARESSSCSAPTSPFPIAVAQDVELLHCSLLSFFHRLTPTLPSDHHQDQNNNSRCAISSGGRSSHKWAAASTCATSPAPPQRWSRQFMQCSPLFNSPPVFFPRLSHIALDESAPHQLVVTVEQVQHREAEEKKAHRKTSGKDHRESASSRLPPQQRVISGFFAQPRATQRPRQHHNEPHYYLARRLGLATAAPVTVALETSQRRTTVQTSGKAVTTVPARLNGGEGSLTADMGSSTTTTSTSATGLRNHALVLSPHVDPRLLLTEPGRRLALLLRAAPQAAEVVAVVFTDMEGRLGAECTPHPSTTTTQARVTLRSSHFTKDLLRWATRESQQWTSEGWCRRPCTPDVAGGRDNGDDADGSAPHRSRHHRPSHHHQALPTSWNSMLRPSLRSPFLTSMTPLAVAPPSAHTTTSSSAASSLMVSDMAMATATTLKRGLAANICPASLSPISPPVGSASRGRERRGGRPPPAVSSSSSLSGATASTASAATTLVPRPSDSALLRAGTTPRQRDSPVVEAVGLVPSVSTHALLHGDHHHPLVQQTISNMAAVDDSPRFSPPLASLSLSSPSSETAATAAAAAMGLLDEVDVEEDAMAYMEDDDAAAELLLAEDDREGGLSAIDQAVRAAALTAGRELIGEGEEEDGAREAAPEHVLQPNEDDGVVVQRHPHRTTTTGSGKIHSKNNTALHHSRAAHSPRRRSAMDKVDMEEEIAAAMEHSAFIPAHHNCGRLRDEDRIAAKDLQINEADAETSFVGSEGERPRTEAPFTPCCFANGIKLHWISQHSMILQRCSTKQPWGLAIECLESPEEHPDLLPMRLVRLPPPRLVKRRGKMILEQHSFLDFFNRSPRHNWYIDTINGLAARHPDHSIPWMSSLTHMVLKFKRL